MKTDKEIEDELVDMYDARQKMFGNPKHQLSRKKIREEVRKQIEFTNKELAKGTKSMEKMK